MEIKIARQKRNTHIKRLQLRRHDRDEGLLTRSFPKTGVLRKKELIRKKKEV